VKFKSIVAHEKYDQPFVILFLRNDPFSSGMLLIKHELLEIQK